MPVRDDWAPAAVLIRKIDAAIGSADREIRLDIVLIDDCSVEVCDPASFQHPFRAVRRIRVVRLRRNLGHQRAISIGLAHVRQTEASDAVIVMDADGEDTPHGVLRLIDAYLKLGASQAVFAARSRRVESRLFRMFYQLYKVLHRGLTGLEVQVGNFSILPSDYLDTLVILNETWNHYAAAVFRSKLPFTTTSIPRGYRIAGESKMNFVMLVTHGLSAISVFADVVGVRLLIVSMAGVLLAGFGIALVAAIRLFTSLAIPGWATYAAGTLAIILIQCLTIAASFTFFMLSSRTNMGFIPLRDHVLFIAATSEIFRSE
jgi:glycosyltransferase involved in cell wall biosynthesis